MHVCTSLSVYMLIPAHNTPPFPHSLVKLSLSDVFSWCGPVPLVCRGHIGSSVMSVHLSASLCGQRESHLEDLCETHRHSEGSVTINNTQLNETQMSGETPPQY